MHRMRLHVNTCTVYSICFFSVILYHFSMLGRRSGGQSGDGDAGLGASGQQAGQGEPGRARESPKIEKNTEHAVNQGQIQRRQSEPCTLTRLEIVKQVELMFTSHSSRFATSTPREMVGFSKLNIIGVNSTGLFGLSCANADPGPTWESFCPICEQVKECGKIAE